MKPSFCSKQYRGRTLRLQIVRLLLFVLFLVSSFMFTQQLVKMRQEEAEFEALASLVSQPEPQDGTTNVPSPAASTPDIPAQEPTILPEYANLYEQNSDFVGWLTVPNTKIDYPVMLTPSDPEYYLRRSFEKKKSLNGTPFIGEGGTTDSDCLIIYAHNMKHGTMFGDLSHYQEKSFWEESKSFTFDTLYEHREYEVFAALKTRILNTDETGFRYYYTSGELTDERHAELTNWLIEHSLYDTGIVPANGEQILILSTCSYHTKNGRFIVAARRKPVSDPLNHRPENLT